MRPDEASDRTQRLGGRSEGVGERRCGPVGQSGPSVAVVGQAPRRVQLELRVAVNRRSLARQSRRVFLYVRGLSIVAQQAGTPRNVSYNHI